MGFAAPVATAVSSVIGAAGAYMQGQAKSNTDKYNAVVALNNSQIATKNATWAGLAGDEAAATSSLRTKAAIGSTKTNQAASGVDVNSGSAAKVQQSEAEIGKLDALTIRSNAAREAYGYQTQATSFQSDAILDKQEAKDDATAGDISAATTFLGGASNAASQFASYQNAGGFSG